MMNKSAIFSRCRRYRYILSRIWLPKKNFCLFVCLNPSTADENQDDPTIRRCIRFAEAWGFGGIAMLNLFALRSTKPAKLYKSNDPIGPMNDYFLRILSSKAGITVAAWGNHGRLNGRGDYVLHNLLKEPYFLKLTKSGMPNHPLYLPKDTQPKKF